MLRRKRSRSKHKARAAAMRRRLSEAGEYADGGVGVVGAAAATAAVDADGIPEATANFETYYRAQRLFASEAEWGAFMATLREPLPVTFRVSTTSPFLEECVAAGLPMLTSKATIFSQQQRGGGRGVFVEPPKRLEWCNTYQLGCSGAELKNASEPALVKLRRWLSRWCALGVLTRQEVVSMIPVSFLGVQPGHHVLDMCAAPGSKTTQVLDILQRPVPSGDAAAAAAAQRGMVVANDLDARRGYMLVRRCTAMGLATSRLVVTQHMAQKFPDVSLFPRRPDGPASRDNKHAKHRRRHATASGTPPQRQHEECAGVYDRIVCDVPCCGDGTLRKSPSVWQRWHPQFALGLHSLQVQIAMRGAALLKVGGRMAYSTCTFNPVENEAVVAEVLRRCGGALELVDVSDMHPGLKRAPGMRHWCVYDDDMRCYRRFEETQGGDIPAAHRRRFRRSMFPPPATAPAVAHLSRCMRFYPHHQNTGGFFVCVLRKVRPLPAGVRQPSVDAAEQAATALPGAAPVHALARLHAAFGRPAVSPQFRYLPPAPPALQWLQATFGIADETLGHMAACMYSRSSAAGRSLFFAVPATRQYGYLPTDARSSSSVVRVVSAGVRIVNAHRRSGSYLLTQAGAQVVAGVARQRVADLSPADMAKVVAPVPHGKPKRPSMRASSRGRRLLFACTSLSPAGQRAVVAAAGYDASKPLPSAGAGVFILRSTTRLALPARFVIAPPPGGSVPTLFIALTIFHPRGLEHLPAALCDAVSLATQHA